MDNTTQRIAVQYLIIHVEIGSDHLITDVVVFEGTII